MRVFISSVRRGLEAEREAVTGLILAMGHEPVRFEDFQAQAVSSREACMRAVGSADVCLLVLGAFYGDPLPDTGVSPTEEEWNAARAQGIPVLVFRKKSVTPESAQAEFIGRVEDYASGRFRASFDGVKDLLVAIGESLRALATGPEPLVWTALPGPLSVEWLGRGRPGQSVRGLLELQLLPTIAVRIGATALPTICKGILRQARAHGLFEETSGVRTIVDEDGATVELDGRDITGARVRRDGSVIVWTVLPQDTLGVVLDQVDLTTRLTIALRVASDLFAQRSPAVAFGVGLDGLMMASEGEASEVGRRTSVQPSMIQDPVRVEPTDSVPSASLEPAAAEIAAELAAQAMLRFRKRRL